MTNPLTDRLGFIEEVQFEGPHVFGKIPLPMFEQLLPALKGVSQEVFRDGKHFKSINLLKDQVNGAISKSSRSAKIRKGDIIYRISLAPQPYNFVGTIQTRDKYQKIYDMSFELIVSNPRNFAILCFHDKDPVASVVREFKGALESYLSKFEHDKLNDTTLNFENWIGVLSQRYGMIVMRPTWILRADYSREKASEIRQQAALRKLEIETEADIKALEERIRMDRERLQKLFEREEKSRQSEFNHFEKLKYHQNEASIKLLSKTVDELVTINRDRIRDAVDGNGSVKDVVEDTLKLLGVFSRAASKNANVIDGSLLNKDVPFETEEDDLERETAGFETKIDPQAYEGGAMNEDVNQPSDYLQNTQQPTTDSST
ncbi:MAG TPA: hypothetical protein VF043_25305 [Ktedonobacteraceae bacterium]